MYTEKPITEAMIADKKHIVLRLNKAQKTTSTAYQKENTAAYLFIFLERKKYIFELILKLYGADKYKERALPMKIKDNNPKTKEVPIDTTTPSRSSLILKGEYNRPLKNISGQKTNQLQSMSPGHTLFQNDTDFKPL